MEPTTALGVAAAATQFFDIARNLIGQYQDSRQPPVSQTAFRKTAVDLRKLSKTFKQRPEPPSHDGTDPLHKHQKTTEELIDLLDKVQPEDKEGSSAWASIGQAISSVWNADKIKNLEERVGTFQHQLTLRLVAYMEAKQGPTPFEEDNSLPKMMQSDNRIINMINNAHPDTRREAEERHSGVMSAVSLSGDQRSIFRLLELEPAADDHETLRGSLAVVTLEELAGDVTSRYTALSYVWGNPVPVESIALTGCDVGIIANLAQALRDVRHTSRAVVLWADALCINQQDTKERSHQVWIVGDIYRSAVSTIIYLGPLEESVQFLFTHIAARNLERVRLQTEDPPNKPSTDTGPPGAPASGNNAPEADQVDSQTDQKNIHLGTAIRELCTNDWFTRAWAVPELVLSVDPRIQRGRILAR
ncbi:HET-domain-containing protein [Apiospora marii]|uniref:HET-domain-containing protein n=1 Tax=Apiospora marii TaxID=335849 RepID=UPI00312CE59B